MKNSIVSMIFAVIYIVGSVVLFAFGLTQTGYIWLGLGYVWLLLMKLDQIKEELQEIRRLNQEVPF